MASFFKMNNCLLFHIITLFLFPFFCMGESIDISMSQASAYFEAGDYTHAEKIYQNLLQERVENWQKAVISYNLGTLLLAQGKLSEASTFFKGLKENQDNIPQLNYYLAFNDAIVKIQQTKKILTDFLKNNDSTEKEAYNVHFLLWQLKIEIDDVKSSLCSFLHLEGYKECQNSFEMKELMLEIQNLLIQSEMIKLSLKSNNSSWQIVLNDLLKSYTIALLQPFIEKSSLDKIDSQQTLLSRLIDQQASSFPSTVKQNFVQSDRFLKAAIESKLSSLQQRLLLEIARGFISVFSNELLLKGENSAEETLNKILDEQKLALMIALIYRDAQGKEEMSPDVIPLLEQSQKRVNNKASFFYEAVTAQQKREGTKKLAWDEIISLFTKGQEAAKNAQELLHQGKQKERSTIIQQQIAIENWQQALEKLKAHQSPTSQPEQSNSSSSTQNQPQPKKSQLPKESQDKSFDSVARYLQEMEIDDKSHSELKSLPKNNQEDKPW